MLNQFYFVPILVLNTFCLDTQDLSDYLRTKCETDADCRTNAYCFGNDENRNIYGVCKCKTGYQIFSKYEEYVCLPGAKLGGICEINMQCEVTAGPLAVCGKTVGSNNTKFCSCNPSISHAYENSCYETKLLGEFCRVDENCLLFNVPLGDRKFGICNYGNCSCPIGKHAHDNHCVETRKLHEKCENDKQCSATPNAVCRTFCTCEAGFAHSGDICLKAATEFGQECLENHQCSRYLEGSVCVNSKCSCFPDYHGYQTKCLRNVNPGGACFSHGDCIISEQLEGRINCTEGVCTCLFGSSQDSRNCFVENGSFLHKSDIKLMISTILIIYFFRPALH